MARRNGTGTRKARGGSAARSGPSKTTATRRTTLARPVRKATPARRAPAANRAAGGGRKVKRVYFFGGGKAEGRGDMKPLLGGKGANLAQMSLIGLPVPAGFTITTEVCTDYYKLGKKLPPELMAEVEANIAKIERASGKRFGDSDNPLLVAVRSGARDSMPGMMDTILNLGLNDTTVEALVRNTNNGRFAWDCYRRIVQMYGDVVMGVQKRHENEHEPFDEVMDHLKEEV